MDDVADLADVADVADVADLAIYRENVVRELISTEHKFLQVLKMFCRAFHENSQFQRHDCAICATQLCSNMPQVLQVTQLLLHSMEEKVAKDGFGQADVGSCFVALEEEMKSAYTKYCRDYQQLAEFQKNDEATKVWIALMQSIQEQSSDFSIESIDFFRIQPVQRILKYPLMLAQLTKFTPASSPYYQQLLHAKTIMDDVASAINEAKRGKELVLKYKNMELDSTFVERITKINIHSTMKKFDRLARKISGIETVDVFFNEMEKDLVSAHKITIMLGKDVAKGLQLWQNFFAVHENIAQYSNDYLDHSSDQEIQAWTKNFETTKQKVSKDVVVPLTELQNLFEEPLHLVKKRNDKLLDFEIAFRRSGRCSSDVAAADMSPMPLDEEGASAIKAQQDYEALNSQLLDGIPQFLRLHRRLFLVLLSRLVCCQKQIYQTASQLLAPEAMRLSLCGTDSAEILLAKLAKARFLSDLSLAQAAADQPDQPANSTSVKAPRPQLPLPQSASMVQKLRQKYPGRCFRVTQSTSARKKLCLALPKGSVVGVIKQIDGNTDWYVDSGNGIGFVSSKLLTRCEDLQQTPTPRCQEANSPASYVASHAFEARSELEVSLERGSRVTVIQKHDQNGNHGWWFVRTAQGQGYAPASYLMLA